MKGKAGPRPTVKSSVKVDVQKQLPTMENREIAELQEAGLRYAKIRDKRQKLTSEEVALKADVLKLMKKHKRDHYEYNGVEINLVVEEETVKVKIHKPSEEEDGPNE